MNDRRELAYISTYNDLVGALRNRAAELELSCLGADELAGLASGHVSKLFCGTRGFGRISLFALLDALGLSFVLIEDRAKTETARRARVRLGIGRRAITRVRPRPRFEDQPAA